jgi:hypothetical protein
MNLELIEHKCVLYLKHAANPLVPFATLLRFLHNDDECGEVPENDLLEFLRTHAAFKVIDAQRHDPEEIEDLAEAGIDTGPRVILKTRIPTQAEIKDNIAQHMGTMTNALHRALAEATEAGDTEACKRIGEIIERAEKLQEKLDDML